MDTQTQDWAKWFRDFRGNVVLITHAHSSVTCKVSSKGKLETTSSNVDIELAFTGDEFSSICRFFGLEAS